MNLLSLRLDQKNKMKLRRWWYHATDATEFGLISVAIILFSVVVVLWYGLR